MANAPSDPTGGPASSSGRPPRLPRWTRQEILVLIEGKRTVERRGRGRAGAGPLEPKWAAVSAYCKRQGVDRGPVQCRKRWSNLAGDYKKIKEWERGAGGGGKKESFWGMRNDLRREKRLPGFFDREVYDILDGGGGVGGGRIEMEDDEEEDEEKDKVERDLEDQEKLGEGDHVQARVSVSESSGKKKKKGGLFDDDEEEEAEEERSRGGSEKADVDVPVATLVTCAVPISEVRYVQPLHPGSSEPGTSREKQPSDADREKDDVPSQEGHNKRRRTAEDERDESDDRHTQLLQVLERNSRMVAAQLEAQNINLQLDRDQRREQTSSLLGVLNRLADSLSKIADKL